MVHQIRPAWNRCGGEWQRLDQRRFGFRWGRNRRALVDLVDVVHEPNVDSALVCTDKRPPHDVRGLVVQANVVERELERLLRTVDECGDRACDVDGSLTTVGECVNLDHREVQDTGREQPLAGFG